MQYPVLTRLRSARCLMTGVTWLTTFVFVFVFYAPSALAVKTAVEKRQTHAQPAAHQLAEHLQTLKEKIRQQTQHSTRQLAQARQEHARLNVFQRWLTPDPEQQAAESLQELKTLHQTLQALAREAQTGLQQVEAHIQQHQLPETILQRHRALVEQYQLKQQQLDQQLQALQQARTLKDQQAVLEQLSAWLEQEQFQTNPAPFDPHQLPFGTPSDQVREPMTSAAALQAYLGLDPGADGVQLASLDPQVLPEAFEKAKGPKPEDLQPTLEVPFSPAIETLAAELHHNPAEIFSWVHNHIRFIPSYGSIQGAALTLQTRQGNALDTASLTIALLRASGIPARYGYGTVRIPAEQVMNWVGGVDTPTAALQLLGQGGIPNRGLAEGGVVKFIELEHVWTEAYVDYFPARGLKNQYGDSWVPMDTSFKQYDFTAGLDLDTAVPFDAAALLEDITAGLTVNDSEGWVSGSPQASIQQALDAYQTRIQDYLNTQNPDATVGDVLGLQTIQVLPVRPMASGWPYQLTVRQQHFSQVPDNLRLKFRYTLGTQSYNQESARLITFEKTLPELAGQRLALSFKPATQADEDLINSYLPAPDPDTGVLDPNQLPETLPGYLIHLTAELTQNGEVLQSAAAGSMGEELYETLALWSPGQGWRQAVNHPIAGEYRALGLDLQGMGAADLAQLQTQIEATKLQLESQDETQISSLTKHAVVGDLLSATILSYLALNDVQNQVQAKASGMLTYRMPSYGLFSTKLQTSYWFGMPRDVSFQGLNMDVDHLETQTLSKDGDIQKRVAFVQSMGSRASALEHLVPEQMFSTEENPAQGLSAVKALALASAQGQKIWTITQNNLNLALASIELNAEIETEIRNAVLAGQVATAHEQPIAFAGSTGVGYLLIDPVTGSGAYKIGGGENGGALQSSITALLTIMGLSASLGEVLEAVADVGKLFRSVSGVLGPLGVLLSVLDAKLSGCGVGATIGIFSFSFATWSLALSFGFYTLPLVFMLGSIVAATISQFMITSSIKGDYCDN